MIFWLILFTVLILISFLLAKRSLTGYQETPNPGILYSLYFIKNPEFLTLEVLLKIHKFCFKDHLIFSIEKLIQGKEKALGLYIPKALASQLPELGVLEIEDYIRDDFLNKSHTFRIGSKNNPQKPLFVDPRFLNTIELLENQQFFWQVVSIPEKGDKFQVTVRGMMIEQNPAKRMEAVKRLERIILDGTGLKRDLKEKAQANFFDSFRKRMVVPKEVSRFMLLPSDVKALSGV